MLEEWVRTPSPSKSRDNPVEGERNKTEDRECK
jgi:hypothetical protein